MNGIRRTVQELEEYTVPQPQRMIKLNQNESPFDLPESIKVRILQRLRQITWNRYPLSKSPGLVQAISDYTGLKPQYIVCGNGSNELIDSVFQAFCEPGERVMVVEPGFAIFERQARLRDLNIIKVPLDKGFAYNPDAIIDAADSTKLIILASPNNPTGSVLSVEQIKRILCKTRAFVVIDEAYYEFCGVSAQDLLADFGNLVITRTFSKAFGLAGIRLGYLLAQPEVAKQLDKAKLPFSVGIFQQVVGEVVLRMRRYVEQVVQQIIEERQRVYNRLCKLKNIQPFASGANFILFEVKDGQADRLFEMLYQRGILLRSFNNISLKNMLRVTIGRPEENSRFLQEMEGI
ncbi:histidinol-phosphate transaminase [candidate division WOR-3 bacterium 4484_100]|uniref:Histidinol-phosphate aminotransferase n=1 Tax=candidate division WOR-3 bacterium 4484_100 TaxID=1936077 RepID=A0A1V4QIP0_UNCW3|nr:MAG: histidinol-phosphate transaminase [candidate division WOR-3 bacterium 4484_100]